MTTFYFYDLETSGFSPKTARIMQFAGQRTTMDLEPVGEPHNVLIKMTPDTLPDPGAILVTGITPQQTVADGMTEAEFLKLFYEEIATPGTVFVGFNSTRFDDEFMRYLHYRNFYDAYEWHWSDSRSRWDLLDLTRMTRALRPDGIEWPFDSQGKAANRLELLTSVNKLDHANAHDALSDVLATIAWAGLIKQKQPKLFAHLLEMRDKKKVAELVEAGQPFIYSSGKYPAEFHKTTAAAYVIPATDKSGGVVFDLRHDPGEINKLSEDELLELWKHRCQEYPCPHPRVPLKTIKYNRCPAVAPLGVLDQASQERIQLSTATVQQNFTKLQHLKPQLAQKIEKVLTRLDKLQQTKFLESPSDVDGRLYDGFISPADKPTMKAVQSATKQTVSELQPKFKDDRLNQLFPLYKARNFPAQLTDEERAEWDQFCKHRLLSGQSNSVAAKYFAQLSEAAQRKGLTDKDQFLLEELQLWGQSILPIDE